MSVAPSAVIPGRRAAAGPESIVPVVDFGSGLLASLGPDDRGGTGANWVRRGPNFVYVQPSRASPPCDRCRSAHRCEYLGQRGTDTASGNAIFVTAAEGVLVPGCATPSASTCTHKSRLFGDRRLMSPFAPEGGRIGDIGGRLKCARKRHRHGSLDDLVGAGKQRRWHFETKRLCRF